RHLARAVGTGPHRSHWAEVVPPLVAAGPAGPLRRRRSGGRLWPQGRNHSFSHGFDNDEWYYTRRLFAGWPGGAARLANGLPGAGRLLAHDGGPLPSRTAAARWRGRYDRGDDPRANYAPSRIRPVV